MNYFQKKQSLCVLLCCTVVISVQALRCSPWSEWCSSWIAVSPPCLHCPSFPTALRMQICTEREHQPAHSLSVIQFQTTSNPVNTTSISCRIATNCITPSNNTTSSFPLILSALLPDRLQEILLFTPTQLGLEMWLLHPPLRLSVHVFQNQYPQSRPCPTKYSHPTLSKTKQTINNSCIPVHIAAQGTQVGTQKLWNHVNSLGRKNNKKHNQGFSFSESILMKQSQLSA